MGTLSPIDAAPGLDTDLDANASGIPLLNNVTVVPCFATEEAAIWHMPYDGWFSYIVNRGDQGACIYSYHFAHWAFALVLAIMAGLAFVTTVCIIFIFFRRRIKLCCGADKEKKAMSCPNGAITAIIPCYLPNEQFIIEETVDWIMDKVESPGNLTVFVVYNTPRDIPEIENRLVQMQKKLDWPGGRTFRTLRVYDSKSKAANLNAALREVKDEYVVIYDADHHPDRQSLMLLWEKMVRLDQDCVQGSYYMRNLRPNQCGCFPPCTFPFLARIIDAEFFVDWFFMKLVTRTFFMGKAYFSGSNALWRTSVLGSKEFSTTAQTEDVDMAIQQLLEGRNIEFCAESRSGELAPMGFFACWKQRLRWTMGWDETSLKHGGSFTDSGRLNCRARCGLVWTFLVRWFMTLLTVGAVWVGFPLTIFYPLKIPIWGKLITRLGQVCFFSGCGPWFFATLEAILQVKHRGRQSCIQVFFVFLVASPFGFASFFLFNLAQQAVSCYKISTGKVDGWEVTARGPAAGMGWADKREESGMILVEPDSSDGELADSSESDSETGSISG